MPDSRVVKAKLKRIHKRSLTFIYLRSYSNLLCLCFGLRKSMTTSALIFYNWILTLILILWKVTFCFHNGVEALICICLRTNNGFSRLLYGFNASILYFKHYLLKSNRWICSTWSSERWVAMSFRVSAGVIEQVLSKTQRRGNNNTFLLYSRLSLCFPYWPDNNLKQRRFLLQR